MLRAALIGPLTAVFAAAVSVTAYLVLVMKEPLVGSLTAFAIVGGGPYIIAAVLGPLGGMLVLVIDRYPRTTRLLLPLIYAAMAGALWGDWASGNSPHISKGLAEIVSAASWAITALVVVLLRAAARRFARRPS